MDTTINFEFLIETPTLASQVQHNFAMEMGVDLNPLLIEAKFSIITVVDATILMAQLAFLLTATVIIIPLKTTLLSMDTSPPSNIAQNPPLSALPLQTLSDTPLLRQLFKINVANSFPYFSNTSTIPLYRLKPLCNLTSILSYIQLLI